MVVDSSALLAVLQNEAEAERFGRLLVEAPSVLIGAATLFEVSMVTVSRRGERGLAELTALLADAKAAIVPFDERHSRLALEAFRHFGEGRHRASLNYADCMSYALAMSTGLPLLYKGDDFVHTDVKPAV